MLIDPSYEVKADYEAIPRHMANLHRKWNVGILILWYPILKGGSHGPMLKALQAAFPDGLRHEVRFPRRARRAPDGRLGPFRRQPALRAGGRACRRSHPGLPGFPSRKGRLRFWP